MTAVEIFAGPGGFSEGARLAGVTDLYGYEWDEQACATARAAGHHRIQADVADVDLSLLSFNLGVIHGLIGSPPCQSYSLAGKQLGTLDRPRIEAHIEAVSAAGRWLDYDRDGWHDPRSPLVLEPLRFILGLRPEWVALEQVPGVLPLWRAMAALLAEHGYQCDTGVLSAEQYGVPQTRQRAILVARYGAPAKLPAPTHRKYRKGETATEGLFDVLLPWVSMAEALGWQAGLVGFPRRADTPSNNAGDQTVVLDGVEYRARDLRSTDQPAQVVTEKVRSWQLRQSAMANATVRQQTEPAPTITAGHDRAERVWEPAEVVTEHGADAVVARFGNQEHSAARTAAEPAATVRYSERMNACDWTEARPATTKAIRVSVAEAAVLQSFRPDYPFQGSQTAQFRQVGDAVPPLLAGAILTALGAK